MDPDALLIIRPTSPRLDAAGYFYFPHNTGRHVNIVCLVNLILEGTDMLFIYGAKLPVRLLEEIRYWKHQERKHTGLIKAVVPELEPDYVKTLDQWAVVFSDTEKRRDELLRHILRYDGPPSPQVLAQVEQPAARFLRAIQRVHPPTAWLEGA